MLNSDSSNEDKLKKLRIPFEEHQINILPRPYKKDSQKGRCDECGGWHGLPAVHLKYVGHAALTDRLLDVDPFWSWEPMALDDHGNPYISNGGMWIRLTICGITRIGYGSADGKTGPDAIKEIIGDALRNAAMRFGAALELWHKGDLHLIDDDKQSIIDKKLLVEKYNELPDQVKNLFNENATSTDMEPRYKFCQALKWDIEKIRNKLKEITDDKTK